jgi:hypothetical protein
MKEVARGEELVGRVQVRVVPKLLVALMQDNCFVFSSGHGKRSFVDRSDRRDISRTCSEDPTFRASGHCIGPGIELLLAVEHHLVGLLFGVDRCADVSQRLAVRRYNVHVDVHRLAVQFVVTSNELSLILRNANVVFEPAIIPCAALSSTLLRTISPAIEP